MMKPPSFLRSFILGQGVVSMVRYPSLYQINTRVWLRELADRLKRPATLADIPDEFLLEAARKDSHTPGPAAPGAVDSALQEFC
jgi:hypothetical protein